MHRAPYTVDFGRGVGRTGPKDQRWTIVNKPIGQADTETLCHVIVPGDLSTEVLFGWLAGELGVSDEHLWFGTCLDEAMADEIDAFELYPFYDCRHLKVLERNLPAGMSIA